MKPLLIENSSHTDSRGKFVRIFDKKSIEFLKLELMQVNLSENPNERTLRGMHYQVGGPPEHKFISVINGAIYLVVSNAHIVTEKSEIENHYFELSEDSLETLFVPSGLATGWISLSENTIISYLMTSRFQECEYSGFCYDDPFASILWPSSPEVISEKDCNWPLLR
jgi:dTDP-4-dehydrorhamnose 3,5-epimerase